MRNIRLVTTMLFLGAALAVPSTSAPPPAGPVEARAIEKHLPVPSLTLSFAEYQEVLDVGALPSLDRSPAVPPSVARMVNEVVLKERIGAALDLADSGSTLALQTDDSMRTLASKRWRGAPAARIPLRI